MFSGKTCAADPDSTLSFSKTLYHYEDTEVLYCDDGYHVTGKSEDTINQVIHCTENGWDIDNVSCTGKYIEFINP